MKCGIGLRFFPAGLVDCLVGGSGGASILVITAEQPEFHGALLFQLVDAAANVAAHF